MTWSISSRPSIRGSSRAPSSVVDLGLGVEHRGDLLHRRARRLHLPVQVGELLERLEHEREQADRGDQRADLERAVLVRVGAEAEHATLAIAPRNSIAGKKNELSCCA